MSKEIYSLDNKNLLIHPGSDANGVPVIYLGKDRIALDSTSGENSIEISDSGIGFSGPLSIQTSPDQIRFAGFWKINPMVLTSVPSTIYTPTPWLVKSVPAPPRELIAGFVEVAAMIAGLGI